MEKRKSVTVFVCTSLRVFFFTFFALRRPRRGRLGVSSSSSEESEEDELHELHELEALELERLRLSRNVPSGGRPGSCGRPGIAKGCGEGPGGRKGDRAPA